MIRVGRIKNSTDRVSFTGFDPVVVMTKSSQYGKLSPYCLRDEKERYLENIWQFGKVYQKVPASTQYYSQWDRTVIWKHPSEVHVDSDGNLTDEYFNWRTKGMSNPYPVRYPVGHSHRHKCLYYYYEKAKLDYIDARKQIYLKLYNELVRRQPLYRTLLKKLQSGRNLLIMEVDGPHQESLGYYQSKYDVSDDFIEQSSMEATPNNLLIMLNDPLHNFGHGYCLAWCLYEDLHLSPITVYL